MLPKHLHVPYPIVWGLPPPPPTPPFFLPPSSPSPPPHSPSRPAAQIATDLFREFRQRRAHHLRLGASAAFTLAIIAIIGIAIALASDWPQTAKPVPLTACGMALVAATLNLINELFGREKAETMQSGLEGGVHGGAPLDLGGAPKD